MAFAPSTLEDTIVAQSSAPGEAARVLIRMSGEHVPSALKALHITTPSTRGVHRVVLHVPSELAKAGTGSLLRVPAWLLWMPGNATFTGQPTAEIVIAAHPALTTRILSTLCSVPHVRLAGPGEFSARSYIAGKLSLDQAEGIAALIAAQTSSQTHAARALAGGHSPYTRWYDQALTLLALVEAGIDFADQEDVVAIGPDKLAQAASKLLQEIRSFLGAKQGEALRSGTPIVSLAGEPNAGKSTLMNALLRRERAIASPLAGTTRDVLQEMLALGSWAPGAGNVVLQDCPGLEQPSHFDPDEADQSHRATTKLHRDMQHAAQQALRASDCILWCDATGVFDAQAFATLVHASEAETKSLLARCIRVHTCSDRALPHSAAAADVHVCSWTGSGLVALCQLIADRLSADVQAGIGAVLPRHREALVQASHALAAVQLAAQQQQGQRALAHAELIAADLHAAGSALGLLCGGTGSISPDEVLGKIFSTFCVGK